MTLMYFLAWALPCALALGLGGWLGAGLAFESWMDRADMFDDERDGPR